MTLHPIMTLIILCGVTILLSGILSFVGAQVTYNKVDANLLEYTPSTIQVNSLFSLSGLKYIFTNTVLNFVSFTPLSSLIIILIGFGIMEKSGFLKTAITLLTKKAKKNNRYEFMSNPLKWIQDRSLKVDKKELSVLILQTLENN